MARSVEEIRAEIQETLEHYFKLEAQLQQLENDRFRVCIFGSARIRPEHPTYQRVHAMSHLLAELQIDIVTGGGPGLMEAANSAVRDVNNKVSRSYGLTIELPRAVEPANRHLDIKSEHRRFSSRLDEFMRLSHAVIVAPGGIGTLLELVYVWQLVQVGMVPPLPIVLLDRELWEGLVNWMRQHLLGRAYVSPGDFDCIHFADTPEEAVAIIRPEVEKFRARLEARNDEEGAAAATEVLERIRQHPAIIACS